MRVSRLRHTDYLVCLQKYSLTVVKEHVTSKSIQKKRLLKRNSNNQTLEKKREERMGRTNRNMADLNSKKYMIKLSKCDALIRKQGPLPLNLLVGM